MKDSILETIGQTPLVRLSRLFSDYDFQVMAKLEAFNPGGSSKDRPAFHIIKQALESGEIGPNTVIVESSSGNMAIGLAQACSYFGLTFICVVDAKTTKKNIQILEAYGAEIELVTQPDPVTGEYLAARINRVRSLVKSFDDVFWPNQYANTNNAKAQYRMMEEIATALQGNIDYLFCAISTCGTLRGCANYIYEHNLKTKLWAIDALGSVITGGQSRKRLIPGHGASITPQLYEPGLAERCIHVSDLDCVIGCRRLIREEAILAGGSSGAVVMGIDQVKDEIKRGAICVAIFPDRGERYLDTVYSDSWVATHFGAVSHLWTNVKEEQKCEMARS